jgi:outer membrane receptor protein involved in Fe transport
MRYVGDDNRDLSTSRQVARLVSSSYAKIDVHVGLRYESWSASLFVNNVADKRGIVGPTNIPFLAANYIQPRTVGLSVSKSF